MLERTEFGFSVTLADIVVASTVDWNVVSSLSQGGKLLLALTQTACEEEVGRVPENVYSLLTKRGMQSMVTSGSGFFIGC